MTVTLKVCHLNQGEVAKRGKMRLLEMLARLDS